MISSSALKIVSVFLLASSLIEVEAISYQRGRSSQRGLTRDLGIGYTGRVDSDTSKGKGKGGKGKGKAGGKGGKGKGDKAGGKAGGKGYYYYSSTKASTTEDPTESPTQSPTPSPVSNARVPESNLRPDPTDENQSFWFPGSSVPIQGQKGESIISGQTESNGNGSDNLKPIVNVKPIVNDKPIVNINGNGEGSSTESNDNNDGRFPDSTGTTDNEDDIEDALNDMFEINNGDGNTSIEVENGNNGNNEDGSNGERPIVEVENPSTGGGSSIEADTSIGGNNNQGESLVEKINNIATEGNGTGGGDTSEESKDTSSGVGGFSGSVGGSSASGTSGGDGSLGAGVSNGSEASGENGSSEVGGSNGPGTSGGNGFFEVGTSNGSGFSGENGSSEVGGSNGSESSGESASSGAGGSNGSGASGGNGSSEIEGSNGSNTSGGGGFLDVGGINVSGASGESASSGAGGSNASGASGESASSGAGGSNASGASGESSSSGAGGSNESGASGGNGSTSSGVGGSNGSGVSGTGSSGGVNSEAGGLNGSGSSGASEIVNTRPGGSNGSGASGGSESGVVNSEGGGSIGSGTSGGSTSEIGSSGVEGSNESGTSGGNGNVDEGSTGSGASQGNGNGNGSTSSGVEVSDGSGIPNNADKVTGRDENGIVTSDESSNGVVNNSNNPGEPAQEVGNGTEDDSNQSEGAGIGSNGIENPNEGSSSQSNSVEGGMENGDQGASDSSTAVFCPEVSSDKEVLINWIYAVEFLPSISDEEKSEAISIMELKLVSELLQCDQAVLPGKRFVRHRHLNEDGIAGLNYMPLDAKNDDVVCFFSNSTNGGVCETYFGRMEMYLQADTDEAVAINSMLYSIRDTMQRDDFPAVDGIVQVWYLDPNLDNTDIAGISDIDNTKPKPNVEASFSTGTMIAFAALGLFVFAAIVLGAFRVRRNGSDGITAFDPSTITGSAMTTTNDSYGTKQFSAILPNSYTLDNARGMSAIPEGDDDSESRFNSNSSVIMSEGGFTSDGDSQTDDHCFVTNYDAALGANKMDEDAIKTDNDLIFENTESFSRHRKQNLVSPAQVSLGVKHSTVDVHQCTSANCKVCNYKPKDVEFIYKSPNSPDVSMGKFFPDDEATGEML